MGHGGDGSGKASSREAIVHRTSGPKRSGEGSKSRDRLSNRGSRSGSNQGQCAAHTDGQSSEQSGEASRSAEADQDEPMQCDDKRARTQEKQRIGQEVYGPIGDFIAAMTGEAKKNKYTTRELGECLKTHDESYLPRNKNGSPKQNPTELEMLQAVKSFLSGERGKGQGATLDTTAAASGAGGQNKHKRSHDTKSQATAGRSLPATADEIRAIALRMETRRTVLRAGQSLKASWSKATWTGLSLPLAKLLNRPSISQ